MKNISVCCETFFKSIVYESKVRNDFDHHYAMVELSEVRSSEFVEWFKYQMEESMFQEVE